jgi:hypothetical protein
METQETRGFWIGSGLLEDNNPTSCVLVYYDLVGLRPPPPHPPYICQGSRVYNEDTSQL